jgi:hypothetical protein
MKTTPDQGAAANPAPLCSETVHETWTPPVAPGAHPLAAGGELGSATEAVTFAGLAPKIIFNAQNCDKRVESTQHMARCNQSVVLPIRPANRGSIAAE